MSAKAERRKRESRNSRESRRRESGAKESDKVGDVGRRKSEGETPLQQGAGDEERKRETDLVRLETTKGKPGGAGETVSKEASV
ncbi:hypothetical protein PV417_24770, partial [Streptomyces sp. ME19-03-3]|nr:hypothetical protein [Streptomyces sp. ME19-03-3]